MHKDEYAPPPTDPVAAAYWRGYTEGLRQAKKDAPRRPATLATNLWLIVVCTGIWVGVINLFAGKL
jgi:hypothetical protein